MTEQLNNNNFLKRQSPFLLIFLPFFLPLSLPFFLFAFLIPSLVSILVSTGISSCRKHSVLTKCLIQQIQKQFFRQLYFVMTWYKFENMTLKQKLENASEEILLFSSVQLLSRVSLFVTPCIAARQACITEG